MNLRHLINILLEKIIASLTSINFFRMIYHMVYTKKLPDNQSFSFFVDVVYLLLINSALLVSGPIKIRQTS